jgi:hypothetical protein
MRRLALGDSGAIAAQCDEYHAWTKPVTAMDVRCHHAPENPP